MKYGAWASKNLKVLNRNGPEWACRCPFTSNHRNGDRTPSFSVNVQKGVYYCHACGESGTLQSLAVKLQTPLTLTAPTTGELQTRIAALKEGPEPVAAMPEAWLSQFWNGKGVKYWESRGLSYATIDAFNLGYDRSSNSATIPLRSVRGDVMGVIRRRLSPHARPRYLYPKGFKKAEHLWGAFKAKDHERIAIVEGAVDALACWDIGIPAVAILGSRMSTHQANLIRKLGCREVVIMTDRDPAGRVAARTIREQCRGVLVSVGTYKKAWSGKDPAELTPIQRRLMFEGSLVLVPLRKNG